MNFDLCDHWVIYDPLRSEKTVIAVDRIKTVLSYSRIDISFQEISEKSVEPVLMVVKGLNNDNLCARAIVNQFLVVFFRVLCARGDLPSST